MALQHIINITRTPEYKLLARQRRTLLLQITSHDLILLVSDIFRLLIEYFIIFVIKYIIINGRRAISAAPSRKERAQTEQFRIKGTFS